MGMEFYTLFKLLKSVLIPTASQKVLEIYRGINSFLLFSPKTVQSYAFEKIMISPSV